MLITPPGLVCADTHWVLASMRYDKDRGLVLGSFYFDKIRIRTTHHHGPLVEDVTRGTQRFNVDFRSAARVYPGIDGSDRRAKYDLCHCLIKKRCYNLLDTPGLVHVAHPSASSPTCLLCRPRYHHAHTGPVSFAAEEQC